MSEITPPDDHPDVATSLKRLEDRSYKTYRCRLRASGRLAARNQAWNASLIASSTATTIAAVALLTDESIYGAAGPTLVVCASILTLVASLVSSSLDYSGRSKNLFLNYRRLQRLSAEVERLAEAPDGRTNDDVVETLHRRYDALLDESENHTEADYYHAVLKGTQKKPASAWVQDLVSLVPYVALLAPIGLLVPFAEWVLSGGS